MLANNEPQALVVFVSYINTFELLCYDKKYTSFILFQLVKHLYNMEVNRIWTCVDQLFQKEIIIPGVYGDRAVDGARCDISINNVNVMGQSINYIQQLGHLAMYFCNNFNGTYRIGESDTNVGRAFERCLQSMLPEEVCLVVLSLSGDDCNIIAQDNMSVSIQFNVKLNRVLNDKLIFELNDEEKYIIALENKMRGVELFKNGQIIDAFLRFNKALKHLISMDLVESNLQWVPCARVTDLSMILYNNLASCHLKRGNFDHVVTLCNRVLAMQADNVKALFRRGVAKAELRDFDEAKHDFEQVLQVEPTNLAAITKLNELKHKTVEIHANYANVVKKMFEL